MPIRIYIPSYDEYGEVLSRGAYFSKVFYTHKGIEYNVFMLNEEFIIVEEDDDTIWEEEE